jgi:hypothetical protein
LKCWIFDALATEIHSSQSIVPQLRMIFKSVRVWPATSSLSNMFHEISNLLKLWDILRQTHKPVSDFCFHASSRSLQVAKGFRDIQCPLSEVDYKKDWALSDSFHCSPCASIPRCPENPTVISLKDSVHLASTASQQLSSATSVSFVLDYPDIKFVSEGEKPQRLRVPLTEFKIAVACS